VKVSVVLPAFNEGKFIAKVVKEAKKADHVAEVIVIDGGSTDNTVEEALKAGAKVLYQSWMKYPGKGIAMRDAVDYATGDVLVFTDADILNIKRGMIGKLIKPILNDEADFVKGTFKRRAGRVTELVAKPLLRMFFPEYTHFSQPLSGEIAGKKEVFKSVVFEEDWGVDIGLLIDIAEKGYRIEEVDIGFKEHDMKPLVELGDMAFQVAKAIIKRAVQKGRLQRVYGKR
jgi:glycosyltransferase involved in cell wall biosynthesis